MSVAPPMGRVCAMTHTSLDATIATATAVRTPCRSASIWMRATVSASEKSDSATRRPLMGARVAVA